MDLDPQRQATLDHVLGEVGASLAAEGDEHAALTLAYTHSLHRGWRTALRMLPVPSGITILDVGSGLGILAFELAANQPLHVEGVDVDARLVAHAGAVLERLDGEEFFADGATVRFRQGDAAALPFGSGAFDLAFAREVLQFVPDPVQALGEVYRVLRPGGALCVSDTDDQLHVTWPPPSPALGRLVSAVATVQKARGGDRTGGRKLSAHCRRAGFTVASVVVLPEANHRVVDDDDAERVLVLRQLRAARTRIVEAGAMAPGDFDADLAAVEAEEAHEEFRMTARVIVLALKPVEDAGAAPSDTVAPSAA
ncbi:MAG TPA: methyltransferase domain-containing protein [Acidimicrobiales bacterium]|nr:methyltransferase domain-containing protein [Acidimicrobiales bacterium]